MRRVRRMATFLLLSLLLVYVALAATMYAVQDRLVYVGNRLVDRTPADVGLPYESVTLVAADGVRSSGWFIPAPAARGVVLFLHGNSGTIACCLEHAALFHQQGFATLLLDYRGYGASAGVPSEAGLYADAEAAWLYLVQERRVPAAQIVVYGQSLGGGVATWLATRRQPGAVLLDSTFTSLVDVGAAQYPLLPVRLLSRNRYPSLARMGEVRAPLLIVHSRDDGLIPFRHAETLAAAATSPPTLVALRGPHAAGPVADPQTYRAAVAAFLAGLDLRR